MRDIIERIITDRHLRQWIGCAFCHQSINAEFTEGKWSARIHMTPLGEAGCKIVRSCYRGERKQRRAMRRFLRAARKIPSAWGLVCNEVNEYDIEGEKVNGHLG